MSRFFLGALVALALSCQPRLPAPTPREVRSLVIAADVSTSSGDVRAATVSELRCSEVTGSIRQALSLSRQPLDVLVLGTGGKETGSEPRVLLPWLRYQQAVRLFGQTVSKEDQEQIFLKRIGATCRSALEPENSSPILAAISRGALSLSGHCDELAKRRETCSSQQLIILSDLRENVDAGVKQRLVLVSRMLHAGKPLPPRPSTFPRILLPRVATSICGLGEHVQGTDDVRAVPEAVLTVWREILGNEPTFNAACPRDGESSLASTPSIRGSR